MTDSPRAPSADAEVPPGTGPSAVCAEGARTRSWTWPQAALHVGGLVVAVSLVGYLSYSFKVRWVAGPRQPGAGPPLPAPGGLWERAVTFGDDDKPVNDARLYQHATLPNGLQVLSIQDTRSLSAAYALSVQAGSFSDPTDLPGLMHFLEHMLFLGTEKYPDPTGFDNFVQMQGGDFNAFTAEEMTVYFLELSHEAAFEGLDRFADFFRAPLFNATFEGKEVLAVNSEHMKNVRSSSWRTTGVLSSLANPRSPVSHFHTGNKETLHTIPLKQGIDPVEALKKQFAKLYCPGRMRLVIFGPSTCDDQLKDAAKTFGQIPEGSPQCKKEPAPSFSAPRAWPAERLGKWVDIQGIDPQASLWLTFALPDAQDWYPSLPLDYIEYLFVYAGENSLLCVLRDVLGLVYTLSVSMDPSSAGTMLYLVLPLTEAGRGHPELVADTIFLYLSLLRHRGVSDELYQFIKEAKELSWDWTEPAYPLDTVSHFASRMTSIKPADLMWGESLIKEVNSSLVASLLDQMVPSNMNLGFVHPVGANTTSSAWRGSNISVMPYYGVEYRVRHLGEVVPDAAERWLAWLQSDAADEPRYLREFTVTLRSNPLYSDPLHQGLLGASIALDPPRPIANVLPRAIPLDNAHARNLSASKVVDEVVFGAPPEPLPSSESAGFSGSDAQEGSVMAKDLEVWYRRGWISNTPKNSPSVLIRIVLRPLRPEGAHAASAFDKARMSMFDKLLAEEIQPHLSDIEIAGASYEITPSAGSLYIELGGYEPLLATLVDKVLRQLQAHRGLTSARVKYPQVRQKALQDLRSYTEMPYTYAVRDRNLLLLRGVHSQRELLEATETTTFNSTTAALKEVLWANTLQFTALAMGNVNRTEVLRVVGTVAAGLRAAADMPGRGGSGGEVERVTPVVDPAQPVEVRARNPRAGDPNDVTVVSIISGVSTIRSRVVFGIISGILHTVAFTVLRTAMQLGYVVNGGLVQLSNVDLLSVVVQGNRMNADDMETAIQYVYTVAMPERLRRMTPEEFAMHRAAFTNSLWQEPFHTGEEAGNFWGHILATSGSRCFRLRDSMLRYLQDASVSEADLVDTWNSLITPAHGVRKKIVVKYFGKDAPPPDRPTEDDAVKAWTKRGLSNSTVQLLRREYGEAVVFARADSEARNQILQRSGGRYFPLDINCHHDAGGKGRGATPIVAEAAEKEAKEEEAAASFLQEQARWKGLRRTPDRALMRRGHGPGA